MVKARLVARIQRPAAAGRTGRRADDLAILAFADAVVGVALASTATSSASPTTTARPTEDFVTLLAAALDHPENGLKL